MLKTQSVEELEFDRTPAAALPEWMQLRAAMRKTAPKIDPDWEQPKPKTVIVKVDLPVEQKGLFKSVGQPRLF